MSYLDDEMSFLFTLFILHTLHPALSTHKHYVITASSMTTLTSLTLQHLLSSTYYTHSMRPMPLHATKKEALSSAAEKAMGEFGEKEGGDGEDVKNKGGGGGGHVNKRDEWWSCWSC